MAMGAMATEDILAFASGLVSEHALDADTLQAVDLHSRVRGGSGPRGYGRNRHGLEIAWWVHPKRVRQELEFVLESLSLRGSERIVSIGCGPAFHEASLGHCLPDLRIVGTDFDAHEIETAKVVAKEVGVDNVEHRKLAAENIAELSPGGPFDHAMSVAMLHDVAGLEAMCRGLVTILKPGACFAFTYNPPRQRAQFPDAPPLRDTIAKYFTIEREIELVTPAHSREYFGAMAERSEVERGYPLRWDAIAARR